MSTSSRHDRAIVTPTTDRSLTIREIDVIPIVVPLEKEYRGSYYGMRTRATVITRVITEAGIVGVAYAGDEDSTLADIVRVVRDEISPRLVGEDAFSYERCWKLGFPVTYDQLRDRRIGLVALASVDLAIWDAIGKALGQPLWRLWGGYRDAIAVNVIGGYYGRDLDGIRDEVAEWLELGMRGCKFKIGAMSPAEDYARVAAARDAAGDDFVITVDANQGYTLSQAIEFCSMAAELELRWFEEPCIWSNDRRNMREVRSRGGVPVCAGQSEHSPEACRDLMEAGAIDVCNFDASWSGGYTNWRRMASAAHLYSVELAHHEEPQVAAHLLASQPHGTYLEVFHPHRDPIWWQMIVNRPEVVEGKAALPTEPGLGWVYDEDFIARHTVHAIAGGG
jgi:L-alanine-DL-glutamate epimerase-like enolase superfamily enzyme